MSTADDLARLADLHRRGELSDNEFAQAKSRVLAEGASTTDARLVSAVNQLRRSHADRWIGGVCGGIARLTGVQSWVWRMLLVVLALWGGSGLVAYLLLWIFVPSDPAPAHSSARLSA